MEKNQKLQRRQRHPRRNFSKQPGSAYEVRPSRVPLQRRSLLGMVLCLAMLACLLLMFSFAPPPQCTDGEASNPGPKPGRQRGRRRPQAGWNLESANVSGAHAGKAWIQQTSADLFAIQEHGIWSADRLHVYRAWCQRHGWDT
eukprot:9138352-Karenia_brevis.AAC.1